MKGIQMTFHFDTTIFLLVPQEFSTSVCEIRHYNAEKVSCWVLVQCITQVWHKNAQMLKM